MTDAYADAPAPTADAQSDPVEGLTLDEILSMPQEQLDAMPQEHRQAIGEIQAKAKEAMATAAAERQARVQTLGQTLRGEFERRCTERSQLELRWLDDIRRYNGKYNPADLLLLQNRKYGSQMFVPLTRRLCNIVEARLGDLLFPTEDRNYSIDASPQPEIDDAHKLAHKLDPSTPVGPTAPAAAGTAAPGAMPNAPPAPMAGAAPGAMPAAPGAAMQPPQPTMLAADIQAALRDIKDEADEAARNMQRAVDDQLKEANYGKIARQSIHDGIVIGTGVLKGPMVMNRTKKKWNWKQPTAVQKLTMVEDLSPTVCYVNPWDFYPEMSARTMAESGSEFERHWLNAADLAKLATQPGFDTDAIRAMLKNKATTVVDNNNRSALREAAGTQGVPDLRYEVIEYHGSIETEDLEACGVQCGDDPLMAYEGVVWFAKTGEVLKAIINPMGTGDRPYSVWNWQRDAGCIFGFGLSYEVTDLQDTCNSSFRAAMDNLGLSVGPQIVINTKLISPANGTMCIEPNKLWEALDKGVDVSKAFGFHQIDSQVQELLLVFNGAKALLDEIAGSQMAMQGQENTLNPKTDYQASIAYNASNIWMRRAVKNWDDDISSTLIQRFVDWNMEHNRDPKVKGDVGVTARGTSALLEAEGQVQRLNVFMAQAKDIPMPFKRKVNMLRAMAKAMRLDDVDILPDDQEVDAISKQVDNQPPPADPAQERIKLREAEIADKKEDRAFQMNIEEYRGRLIMAKIASAEGLTREQAEAKYGLALAEIKANLADKAAAREHDSQRFNAEMVVKQTMGSGI